MESENSAELPKGAIAIDRGPHDAVIILDGTYAATVPKRLADAIEALQKTKQAKDAGDAKLTHGRMAVNNALRYRDGLHEAQTALTPKYVLDPVRKVLGGRIDLDPCATPDNPVGATTFFAPPQDGLALPWSDDEYVTIFVNPPYGKAREPWVERCILEAQKGNGVVLLIPAHTDTKCFQRAVKLATSVCFIKSRVKFGVLRPNRRQVAASHPSALIGYNCDVTQTHLGFGWRQQ